MLKKTQIFLIFTVLIALLPIAVSLQGKNSPGNNQTRQKAKYYYLEGARWEALDSTAKAYEYYKKAWLTDPGFPEASLAYGLHKLMNPNEDYKELEDVNESLRLIKQYVEEYPEDFYEASSYAYLCSQVDTTGEAVRVTKRSLQIYPDRTALILSLADLYRIQGDLDSALNYCRRYDAIEGRNVQTTLNKTSLLLAMNDTTGALAEIDSLITDYPLDFSYIALKGKVYDVIQRPDSALKFLKLAESLDPDNGGNKLALAEFYLQHGDSTAYDNKIFEALIAEDFDISQKTGIMSDYLQRLISSKDNTQRGDYLFSVLRKQYPHAPEVMDLAARYSAAKGLYSEAVEEISYAIDLDPADSGKPTQKMSYQIAVDDFAGAMETYQKYYVSKHTAPEQAKMFYATAATQSGHYAEADSVLTEIFNEIVPGVKPDSLISDESLRRSMSYENLLHASIILTLIGDNHYNAKKTESAFNTYQNAIYFYSHNSSALNNYAYFLSENDGDLEKALEMSRQAVEEDPDNSTFLDTLGWILFKLGKTEEALTVQAGAIELAERENSPSSELYEHYAEILKVSGDAAKATEMIEKAHKLKTPAVDSNPVKKKQVRAKQKKKRK